MTDHTCTIPAEQLALLQRKAAAFDWLAGAREIDVLPVNEELFLCWPSKKATLLDWVEWELGLRND